MELEKEIKKRVESRNSCTARLRMNFLMPGFACALRTHKVNVVPPLSTDWQELRNVTDISSP
jgi:hypothetical protein